MNYRDLPVIGEALIDRYSVGDLVKFCAEDMVRMKTGIILDIYTVALSERKFPHADVYVMGDGNTESVLLGNLTIISKVSN
jgi:hypothetical protein|tara:strand:+ start:1028 stop:1270 length:243 start_codon:yes stop_codon:yes gene_type:complete